MNFKFVKLILRKVDIDFTGGKKSGDYEAKMRLDREFSFKDESDKGQYFRLTSKYFLSILNREQLFFFDSFFLCENIDHPVPDELINRMTDVAASIVHPQELMVIENYLNLCGLDMRNKIPLGVSVNV